MVRYHLMISGRVQGVGFRYTAHAIAQKYRLTGFVKNEYDGSVLVEVQGDEAAIDRFIQEVSEGRFIRIDRIDRWEMPVEEDERGFIVQY